MKDRNTQTELTTTAALRELELGLKASRDVLNDALSDYITARARYERLKRVSARLEEQITDIRQGQLCLGDQPNNNGLQGQNV